MIWMEITVTSHAFNYYSSLLSITKHTYLIIIDLRKANAEYWSLKVFIYYRIRLKYTAAAVLFYRTWKHDYNILMNCIPSVNTKHLALYDLLPLKRYEKRVEFSVIRKFL